jgi:hypothetical protein
MLIAILPNTSATETLLNNLSEADFDLAQVSVVMSDPKLRDAIAEDAGALKGANLKNLAAQLVKAGWPQAETKPYVDAVAAGKVLVAIVTPPESEPAAKEMLQGHSAELIKGLPQHAAT